MRKDNYIKTLGELLKTYQDNKTVLIVFEDHTTPFYHDFHCKKAHIKDFPKSEYASLYISTLAPSGHSKDGVKWFTPYLAPLISKNEIPNVNVYVGFTI